MKNILTSIVLAALIACVATPPWVVYDGQNPDVQAVEAQVHPYALLAGLPGLGGWTVRFTSCGFWNAFSDPEHQEIIMCHEVAESGSAVMRMVLLHEAGHAAFHSGLRFTGLEELAADEFSAVVALRRGHADDVDAMADFWDAEYDPIDDGSDPHPSGARRASHMRCLALGARPSPPEGRLWDWYECRDLWRKVDANWPKLW